MFVREANSIVETNFPETYAGASRTHDTIKQNLSSMMADFSLSDEILDDFEDEFWLFKRGC